MTGPDPHKMPLVRTQNLTKLYGHRRLFGRPNGVRAVDDVTLDILRGETLGLVGESGSGKSTLGRLILNLTPISGGNVLFEGQDVGRATRQDMRLLRRRMQIVFQDPYSSLHPRMTVRQTIREGLRAGGRTTPKTMDARIADLLHAVGLGPAHVDIYPHRLSGGQRQRVAIARALSVEPAFIVADEPVSALDVSIQAQILNLLADLQRELGLTYLFISHDLNVIRYLADRVAVMYRGRIVELAPSRNLFAGPLHPYTRLLFHSMPRIERFGAGADAIVKREEPALPQATGCLFYARCPVHEDRCLAAVPPLKAPAGGQHLVACFKPGVLPDTSRPTLELSIP